MQEEKSDKILQTGNVKKSVTKVLHVEVLRFDLGLPIKVVNENIAENYCYAKYL